MGETEAQRRDSWGLALLGGALAGLAPAPLLWLAVALLWSLQGRSSARRASACWGAVAVLVSHRWLLGLHPLDWIGVPLPLSLPLCGLLLLLCAALAGLLLALWSALAVWLQPTRCSSALLLSCLWGLAEVGLARGPLFWIGLGSAALPGDPPLAALARLGGVGLVAALQLLIGWTLWRLMAAPLPGRRGRLQLGVLLLTALLALHGLGWWQLIQAGAASAAAPSVARERVLVLQPAIPTRQKFQWAAQRRLERLLQQALALAQAQRADLVLLPEGALGLEPQLDRPAAVELLSGGFRWHDDSADAGGAGQQRSALLRFPAGAVRPDRALDKHRLVPLGEWVPFAGLMRWSGLSAVGGLEAGAVSRLLERPAGPVAAAICYEISDGAALAAAVRAGAGWLIASANLDPYPLLLQRQFTDLARLRAIENGRWLVSAANTGPTLLINPAGAVLSALPPARAATAVVEVPVLRGSTPYVAVGEAPLLALLVLSCAWRLRGPLWRRLPQPI